MKIDQVLEDSIKARFNPRKPIFITRTKMFLLAKPTEWSENCHGLLIIYIFNNAYYMFEILFDMEIYSNFTKYAKFMGENKMLVFLLPCKSRILQIAMFLQSKQELTELKKVLEVLQHKSEDFKNADFYEKPEVHELIKAAQIDEDLLESNLRFRRQAEDQIKNYFEKIDNIGKRKNANGFKAYGLGREQWKLQMQQIQYLKDKNRQEVIQNLSRLQRQARMM